MSWFYYHFVLGYPFSPTVLDGIFTILLLWFAVWLWRNIAN